MILGYRAEYLAKAHTAVSKPILILCYNEPLAVKLASVMEAKGLSDMVHGFGRSLSIGPLLRSDYSQLGVK